MSLNFLEHKCITLTSFIVGTLTFLAEYFNVNPISKYIYLLAFILIVSSGICAFIIENKKEKFFRNSDIHIPVVINVDSNKPANHVFTMLIKEIEDKYGFRDYEEGLKKYLNVVRNDLIYEYGVGLENIYQKEKLLSFLQIISYNLNKIQSSINNKVIFHVAYYQRPAVAFLAGNIFENDEIVVYQNNPDKDFFDEVAHTQNRNYKTKVREFEKFSVTYNISDIENKEVLLVINASSHTVNLNSDSLKQYNNKVIMNANHNGTILLSEDWMRYVREIFTVLDKLQTQYSHIIIAHAMPESIALLVGMAIGHYWNVTITQYDNGEYREFFNMKNLRLYY